MNNSNQSLQPILGDIMPYLGRVDLTQGTSEGGRVYYYLDIKLTNGYPFPKRLYLDDSLVWVLSQLQRSTPEQKVLNELMEY